MIATISGGIPAFLCRATLIAGMLAIIAGIFGMHIIAGPHSVHAMAAAEPGTATVQVAESGHGDHGQLAAAATAATQSTTGTAWCLDQGSCPSVSTMGSVCMPVPGTASLAAPLPGSVPFVDQAGTDAAITAVGYAYLPGSPSPGELCISRT